jgi:hypothetical protein
MDKILPSIDKDAISPARFKKNLRNPEFRSGSLRLMTKHGGGCRTVKDVIDIEFSLSLWGSGSTIAVADVD